MRRARSPDGLRIALTHVYAWPEVRRGGERYLHELAAALTEAGHHVIVFSSAPAPGRGRVLGVEVRYLRRRSGHRMAFLFRDQGDEVAFAARALAHLGSRRLDVWHALGTADAAAASAVGMLRRTRSVYTDLGIPDRPYREQRSDWRLHRFVTRHVDGYVCLSRAAGEQLRLHYGRDPAVIGGGVDLRRFQPAPERHPTPALLFTSAVTEPRKNAPLLLEAVALLRKRHPQLELWLAGPGEPAPLLDAAPAAGRNATVQYGAATLEELASLYGRAWVTVLPSQNEAFGLVALESLASGTPVVTLVGGAPAELISPDIGVTSAPTPEALAEACERALDLARDPAIQGTCRAAAEPHDWRLGIVPRMEAIYRDAPVSA